MNWTRIGATLLGEWLGSITEEGRGKLR